MNLKHMESTRGAQVKNSTNIQAYIDPAARDEVIQIELSGAIFGDQADALCNTLRSLSASHKPAGWALNLENLDFISARGLHVLRAFARLVQKRGCTVELRTIKPELLEVLKDLEMRHLFRGPNRIAVSSDYLLETVY